MVGELQINEWNGIQKPQLLMKDIAVKSWQLFDFRGMKNWYEQLQLNESNQFFVSFQGMEETRVPVCDKETALNTSNTIEALYLLDIPTSLKELVELVQKTDFKRLILCFQTQSSQFFGSLPARDDFKWLYQLLMKRKYFDYKKDAPKLSQYKGWKLDKIKFMFQVFHELELVSKDKGNIIPVKSPVKKDLTEAHTYQERKQMMELEEILIYSSYSQLKTWLSEQMKQEKPKEEVVYGL